MSLVGFIHQYGENDFSIWNVQLSAEDKRQSMQSLKNIKTMELVYEGIQN